MKNSASSVDALKNQYERFPYPPIGRFALPRRKEGQALRYELGLALSSQRPLEDISPTAHKGIRILVAGAGTLEALVVAQTHPLAKEVVAVDLSENSLRLLSRRARFARLARFPKKLAPITVKCSDLKSWLEGNEEPFDYILASNLLHHVEDPAKLLAALAKHLKQGGILRMITYPKASRVWMREASSWLKLHGLSTQCEKIQAQSRKIIDLFPRHHPARSCFESQPETGTEGGLVDAFLNACENPLSPLEWKNACIKAGLVLFAEMQTESSRSSFLCELLPKIAKLDSWERLQVLDDLLELCANPLLWLKKDLVSSETVALPLGQKRPQPVGRELTLHKNTSPEQVAEAVLGGQNPSLQLPSHLQWELGQNLKRAEVLLQRAGISLSETLQTLRTQVGPRVSAPRGKLLGREKILPGLSITEYNAGEIMSLSEPWGDEEWTRLEKLLNKDSSEKKWRLLRLRQKEPPFKGSFAMGVRWIQLRYGALESKINLVLRKEE